MVKQINVRQLKDLLDAGRPVYLVDVRQPWEHETAALPDSLLIPLGELPARAAEVAPPDGALVVAYCHHGIRSMQAATLLQHLGHDVASLAGGIDHWSLEIDRSVPRY